MNTRHEAFITGASSGIGLAFANALAARGMDLVLVARRVDRLARLAQELHAKFGVAVEPVGCDLANEASVAALEERLLRHGRLRILVNNAGFGSLGRFYELPVENQDRMHRVHVLAPMRLMHAALPGMIQRGSGAIINVSSVAAFLQSDGNVSYCATKTWMKTFTEGLAIELAAIGSPVRVQALCPGYTKSEFHDTLGMDRSRVPAWMWMTADFVVAESLRGLEQGRTVVIPGWRYRAMLRLYGLLPGAARLRFGLRSARYRQKGGSAG